MKIVDIFRWVNGIYLCMTGNHHNNFSNRLLVGGGEKITSHTPSPTSPSNRIHYPDSLETELKSMFRYEYSIDNVYAFFDYLFRQMYLTGDRWIQIPWETVRGILGQSYNMILPKLTSYINIDHSYSDIKHNCKSYTFKPKFVKFLAKCNTWANLNKYVKSISYPLSTPTPGSRTENSSSESLLPIMSLGEDKCYNNTYTLDLEEFKLVSRQLFDISHFDTILGQQATIQTTKTLLKNILTDNLNQSVSDKNGRHYNEITQLMRDFRKCIIKNTEKFVGELDLKCCHGLISLNIFRPHMTSYEFQTTFNLFKSESFWGIMMEVTGVKVKDKVKSKFQLFMNGSLRDNGSNPIFKYFSTHHKRFTDILFQFKIDHHFSNDINQIEASVMHSEELAEYMKTNGLNADIVHDCLWLYGKGYSENNILNAAQYIIRMFKRKYGYDMVFTLEIMNKPKEIIELVPEVATPVSPSISILDYFEDPFAEHSDREFKAIKWHDLERTGYKIVIK